MSGPTEIDGDGDGKGDAGVVLLADISEGAAGILITIPWLKTIPKFWAAMADDALIGLRDIDGVVGGGALTGCCVVGGAAVVGGDIDTWSVSVGTEAIVEGSKAAVEAIAAAPTAAAASGTLIANVI